MKLFGSLTKLFVFSSLFLLVFTNFAFVGLSAEINISGGKNPIDLRITNVTAGGVLQSTRKDGDNWVYDGELTKDDDIRYRWSGVDLNTKYKSISASGGGYVRVYSNEVKDANLLVDQGLDVYPLRLSTIADKLANGSNKLLFVYINSGNNTAFNPVTFTFNFKNVSNKPVISIVKPLPNSIFMKGVEQEIVLQLSNFKLANSGGTDPSVGKVKVYFNEVKVANDLGTISSGRGLGDGKFEVNLKSSDLTLLPNTPDSDQTKLIFVLTDITEKPIGIQSEVIIKTNYSNSLNVGLPRVTIVEPKKDRSNLSIDGNSQFILQIENFEILKDRPVSDTLVADGKKGFLQIIVNNGDKSQPLQPVWGKTEFTLNEIGYSDSGEGQRNVKVQLVDVNFELLKPEASDSIDIFYTPPAQDEVKESVNVQNNTWRIVIIVLTVVLIVGGISILITRG
jgi:hypothetical protein